MNALPPTLPIRTECPPGACVCDRDALLQDPQADARVLLLTREEEKCLLQRLEQITNLADLRRLQQRGQRQGRGIACASLPRPRRLVLDEPVSALDVSVQAQVLNVLLQLQQQLGLAYLLISHDLAVISHLCHHMLVLHAGEVVESGSPQQLQRAAHDPITQALLRSVPTITPGAARQRYAAHHNQ